MESPTRPFHLKPFSLFHNKSTMKAGTDAMLLGLSVELEHSKNILEIGTGSGIISLLMASRCKADITAIDIDEASIAEATVNFRQSPFHHRLEAKQIDFTDFYSKQLALYDLIVSNPPFFINDQKSEIEKLKNARHGVRLNYGQICEGSFKLLRQTGKLWLILPYDESREFISISKDHGFYLHFSQLIFPKRGLQPNRIILKFGKTPKVINESKFVIREENGAFTDEYNSLFKGYLIASS